MFTKTTFALAIILGAASAALAATTQDSVAPHDVYDTRGRYVGYDRMRTFASRCGGIRSGASSSPRLHADPPITGRLKIFLVSALKKDALSYSRQPPCSANKGWTS
jgi:hypothetical protein